jgi:hypothetical protein
MKKIRLLTLAVVFALGSLGVAYAAWADEITIEGSIETGNLELKVEGYSGTEAWKVAPDGIEVLHGWLPLPPPEGTPVITDPVGYATARAGDPDDNEADIVFEFVNLFPGVTFCADTLVHYVGNIPAYVSWVIESGDPWLNKLGDAGYVKVKWYKSNADGDRIEELVDVPKLQMHYCEYIIVEVCVEIPQDNDLQGLTGSFSGSIDAIQWNEYEESPYVPPTAPPDDDHQSSYADGTAYTNVRRYVSYEAGLAVPLVFGPEDNETVVGSVTFAPVDGCVDILIAVDVYPWGFSEDEAVNIQIHGCDELPPPNAPGDFDYQLYAPRSSSAGWSTYNDGGICIPVATYYVVHVNVD